MIEFEIFASLSVNLISCFGFAQHGVCG